MLAILTPSRGRPERAAEMLAAIKSTTITDWYLYLGLDDDDLALPRYVQLFDQEDRVQIVTRPRMNLVEWTNELAKIATMLSHDWLASLGDDHLPRTPGWDERLIDAIRAMGGHGFAHGNDLLNPTLPTAWVQSTSVFEALGWMMLPSCQHLMVDVVVRDLGRASGRLASLPSVIVEHMHPAAGKAVFDESYAASNSGARVSHDAIAHAIWVRDELARDAETIRNL